MDAETLLMSFDLEGLAVSSGSACSSGTVEPSPVIRALGRDDAEARCAIRFSLGRFNTAEDVDRVLAVLPAAVSGLRSLSVTK